MFVDLVQAVFFLLLTSLSKHITFSLAYLVAPVAYITLIGVYLATILRGWQRGVGFSSALVILYAALLLGSLLLFVALADLMRGTRRIDRYARHKDYRVVIGQALGLAP